MARLNDFEIAEIAVDVGFARTHARTAVAVALAESGGRTDVVNEAGNVPPSRDRGLWQINSYWHPEVSDREAFDPVQCGRAAYRISKSGADWHPWATWTSGAYLSFAHRAAIAVSAVNPDGWFDLHRYLRLVSPQLYGVDVAALQHHLRIDVDGVFGPVTAHALQTWQGAHHLAADGVVGPETARVLGWTWDPKSAGG